MFVRTETVMVPVGYDYKLTNEGVEILGVVVDSLVPTKITLMPSLNQKKPGKSAPSRHKNGPQEPDPFDIGA